jgi:hypothetical protein
MDKAVIKIKIITGEIVHAISVMLPTPAPVTKLWFSLPNRIILKYCVHLHVYRWFDLKRSFETLHLKAAVDEEGDLKLCTKDTALQQGKVRIFNTHDNTRSVCFPNDTPLRLRTELLPPFTRPILSL